MIKNTRQNKWNVRSRGRSVIMSEIMSEIEQLPEHYFLDCCSTFLVVLDAFSATFI